VGVCLEQEHLSWEWEGDGYHINQWGAGLDKPNRPRPQQGLVEFMWEWVGMGTVACTHAGL